MNTVTPHTFAFNTFKGSNIFSKEFMKEYSNTIMQDYFLLSVEGSEVWKI